jgi:hypothetical protein
MKNPLTLLGKTVWTGGAHEYAYSSALRTDACPHCRRTAAIPNPNPPGPPEAKVYLERVKSVLVTNKGAVYINNMGRLGKDVFLTRADAMAYANRCCKSSYRRTMKIWNRNKKRRALILRHTR